MSKPAITVGSVQAFGGTSNFTPVTTGLPLTAGDFLAFVVGAQKSGTTVPTCTTATSGWAVAGGGIAGSVNGGAVFIVYKTSGAAGGDAAPSITTNGTERVVYGVEVAGATLDLTTTPETTLSLVTDTTVTAHTISLASYTNSAGHDQYILVVTGGRSALTTGTPTGGGLTAQAAMSVNTNAFIAAGDDLLTSGSSATYGYSLGAGSGNSVNCIVGIALKIASAATSKPVVAAYPGTAVLRAANF